MKKIWLWILGGLGMLGVLTGLFVKFRDFFIKKKVDDTLKQVDVDNKAVDQAVTKIDDQQQQNAIQEARVDQQLVDLKTQKIDNQDIANFITDLEKKANDKNN